MTKIQNWSPTKGITMNLQHHIRARFLERLLATPAGRAHMLNLAVDAEEGDEAGIFDQLLARVDDPELKTMVRRHRDDERRHAEMFRVCLRRTGVDPGPVPDELRLIRRIAGKTDGLFDRGLESPEDIVHVYALLLAIEERGVQQFPLLGAAFARFDRNTSATFAAVTRDEERHTRYCHTIGRHYARSETEWQRALTRFAAIEAEAYAEAGVANVTIASERGFVDLNLLERLALGAVHGVLHLRTRIAA
jgi:rubrerythrin